MFTSLIKKHQQLYDETLSKIDLQIKFLIKRHHIRKFLGKYVLPLFKKHSIFINYYVIIIYIWPKLLVLIVFFFDIFYRQTFYYFYFILGIYSICLFSDYLLYTIKQEIKIAKSEIAFFVDIKRKGSKPIIQKINTLEIITLPENVLLDVYIKDIIENNNSTNNYILLLSLEYIKKAKDPKMIAFEKTKDHFQKFLNFILDLEHIVLILDKQKNIIQIYSTLFFTGSYLIGWIYILFLNRPSLDVCALIELLNHTCKNIEEPFSGLDNIVKLK